MEDDFLLEPESRFRRMTRWMRGRATIGTLATIGAIIVAALLLYYPVGMAIMHKIDDDPNFDANPTIPEGASYAVAVAADLVEREVEVNGWRASDPFFFATAPLDNMPNFQLGVMAAISRFAVEMTDQIGRARGSSQADADLDEAAGFLKYPGTRWLWDLQSSLWPRAPAADQYREGVKALRQYNDRLAAGQAVFERRADNLLSTLERVATDLGSSSGQLERQVLHGGGILFDFTSDDIFYNTKGKLYAYALLFRALGRDFAPVIEERNLTTLWKQTEDSLFEAAALQPWVVINGSPMSQVLPSHLAAQGFFLLRARVQIREITNVLLK